MVLVDMVTWVLVYLLLKWFWLVWLVGSVYVLNWLVLLDWFVCFAAFGYLHIANSINRKKRSPSTPPPSEACASIPVGSAAG